MLDEALSLAPQDDKAKDLQNKIESELDKLSNVTKFFFNPVLYDFGKDAGSRPSTVIARGSEVYVLDSGLNRVYRFVLNETKDQLQPTPLPGQPTPNPIVMRQGDERGNIVIGRLADICWSTSGSGCSSTGVRSLTGR